MTQTNTLEQAWHAMKEHIYYLTSYQRNRAWFFWHDEGSKLTLAQPLSPYHTRDDLAETNYRLGAVTKELTAPLPETLQEGKIAP